MIVNKERERERYISTLMRDRVSIIAQFHKDTVHTQECATRI